MPIQVLISLPELNGRRLDLGAVPEDLPLMALRDRCLDRVRGEIEVGATDSSRHFWSGDRFLPYRQKTVGDVMPAPCIRLELRLDRFEVTGADRSRGRFAIDPEMTAHEALEGLLGARSGHAGCCYELRDGSGLPLDPARKLHEQRILPESDRVDRAPTRLSVGRRPAYWRSFFLRLGAALGLGLVCGLVLHRLGV